MPSSSSKAIPSVLIGCPTSEHKAYCLQEYAKAATSLTYPSYDVLLVDNSATDSYAKKIQSLHLPVLRTPFFPSARERIVHSRNLLRQKALDGGYDYLLSLEQDVIPPMNIIERLLAHKKPVVAGVYYMEYDLQKNGQAIGKKILPLLYKKQDTEHLIQYTSEEVEGSHFLLVAASGLGCMLIHRSVLARISFRYESDKLVFDDIWFCRDLERERIPLYADTSVKCKHLMRAMDWDSLEK